LHASPSAAPDDTGKVVNRVYIKPVILNSFSEEEILGEDRVAFADALDGTVPGWTHYGTWSNSAN